MFGRRSALEGLIAAAFVAAAAAPLVPADAEARVVCRVYTEGNQRVTEFCNDGYLCDLEARKCRPGPEARRKMEAERARKLAEAKRRQGELRERLRAALKQTRRVEPRRPAAAGPNPFNCSYKPAGGGAAWDAMCLDTVMSDPQRLAALRCNPGEICPRGAGGTINIGTPRGPAHQQQTTYRTGTYTPGTYTPGTWYQQSDDWRRVPSPQYHQARTPPPQAARPVQRLRDRLKMRLRYREAEQQVDRLIAERNKHARNSAAWNAMNEALKTLDQTLTDNGYDLSSTFQGAGVYGGGDQDDGSGSGAGGGGGGGAADNQPPEPPPSADGGAPAAGEQAKPAEATAPPEPEKKKLSSRDEVYCSFILYRVHQNDLAYRELGQIPEQCRTDEMKEALAEQQRKHPTIIFDSSDREAIERMIGEVEALRDQAPPSQ